MKTKFRSYCTEFESISDSEKLNLYKQNLAHAQQQRRNSYMKLIGLCAAPGIIYGLIGSTINYIISNIDPSERNLLAIGLGLTIGTAIGASKTAQSYIRDIGGEINSIRQDSRIIRISNDTINNLENKLKAEQN